MESNRSFVEILQQHPPGGMIHCNTHYVTSVDNRHTLIAQTNLFFGVFDSNLPNNTYRLYSFTDVIKSIRFVGFSQSAVGLYIIEQIPFPIK